MFYDLPHPLSFAWVTDLRFRFLASFHPAFSHHLDPYIIRLCKSLLTFWKQLKTDIFYRPS